MCFFLDIAMFDQSHPPDIQHPQKPWSNREFTRIFGQVKSIEGVFDTRRMGLSTLDSIYI